MRCDKKITPLLPPVSKGQQMKAIPRHYGVISDSKYWEYLMISTNPCRIQANLMYYSMHNYLGLDLAIYACNKNIKLPLQSDTDYFNISAITSITQKSCSPKRYESILASAEES